MPGLLGLFSLSGVPVLAQPTYLMLECLAACRDDGMQENPARGFICAVGLVVAIVARRSAVARPWHRHDAFVRIPDFPKFPGLSKHALASAIFAGLPFLRTCP